MKHLFIINPKAGSTNRTTAVINRIQSAMEGQSTEFEIYVTKSPMDAVSKIQYEASVAAGDLRVYACGGDGTLNECVNGAVGLANVLVTHYPTGTGNDFIKTFPEQERGFHSLKRLINGSEQSLDLISVNGRACINICSVGIDARIGTQVHNYSSGLSPGKLSYALSAAANVTKGISMPARVRTGSYTFQGDITLVCICNGGHYGGMFTPMPDAEPDDGLLDLLIVRKVSRLRFLMLIGSYARGKYKSLEKYITHIRGTSMQIESDSEFAINLDGELMTAKTASINIIPEGIRFIFPSDEPL